MDDRRSVVLGQALRRIPGGILPGLKREPMENAIS